MKEYQYLIGKIIAAVAIIVAAIIIVHFTELSGRHSVLERPLSEVNGRLFFS